MLRSLCSVHPSIAENSFLLCIRLITIDAKRDSRCVSDISVFQLWKTVSCADRQHSQSPHNLSGCQSNSTEMLMLASECI